MAFQMGDRLHTTVLKITAGTEGEGEGEGVGDGQGHSDQATHLVFGLLSLQGHLFLLGLHSSWFLWDRLEGNSGAMFCVN